MCRTHESASAAIGEQREIITRNYALILNARHLPSDKFS